jgi:peptidyl-prolyl cis-trans isomerase SurA
MLLTALLCGLAGTSVSRVAHADVVERVVAVINDEAIFLSQLRRRSAPFLGQVMQQSDKQKRLNKLGKIYERVLDKLIEEELIEQAAKRMQVRVNQQDIKRAIKRVKKRSGLTGDRFWKAVRKQGMTEAQYRRNLHHQLLRLKVLNKRVRGRVNITEADVRQRYEQRLREANRKLRFHASHCFFAIPQGASATKVAQIREKAQKARQGLKESNFGQCIDQHGGGDLGWLSQGDMPGPLEKALLALRGGEVSQPVRGSSGYHVFLLHERERGSTNVPSFEKVRRKLFRKMLDEAMAKQEKQFLKELRSKAMIDRRL